MNLPDARDDKKRFRYQYASSSYPSKKLMGHVCIRHCLRHFATQSSNFVDRAWWQTKMDTMTSCARPPLQCVPGTLSQQTGFVLCVVYLQVHVFNSTPFQCHLKLWSSLQPGCGVIVKVCIFDCFTCEFMHSRVHPGIKVCLPGLLLQFRVTNATAVFSQTSALASGVVLSKQRVLMWAFSIRSGRTAANQGEHLISSHRSIRVT